MSKKMMKRTAALSALIAVALSGTVFAASGNLSTQISAGEINGTGTLTATVGTGNTPALQTGNSSGTLSETVTIGGYSAMVLDGSNSGHSNAFNAYKTTTININVGDISTASTANLINTTVFHAQGGTLNLGTATAPVGDITLTNVANGFMSQNGGQLNVYAGDITVTANNGNALQCSYNQEDASMNITASNLSLTSTTSAGISSMGGDVVIDVDQDLTLVGSNAVNANHGGSVSLEADEIAVTDNGSYNALRAANGGSVTLTPESKADITGDVVSEGTGSSMDVDLGDGGSLTGNVTTDAGSTTALELGEDSTWTSDADSNLTTLTVNDGNIVMDSETQQTITVDNFAGEGATITTNSLNNQFNATNSTAEGTTVKGGAAITEQLENMTDAQAQALYADLLNTVSGNVDVTELAFEEAGLLGESTVAVTANGFGKLVTKENKANGGLIDMTALSFMAWRGENDDLNERLGDLRSAKQQRGIWTRMSRAEQSYNTVTNQYSMYQIGYDQEAGDWTVGAAYSYTDGKSWFDQGTGENTHNVFSLYGTKMNDNGSFIDVVAKYGNLDYDYTLAGGVGGGDYDTDAYSFSVETGKRITSSNGVWVEPQFQLTYGMVDDVAFKTQNGFSVNMDSADSFVARAGIMAGKPVHKGNIYLKASYLYDFAGEVEGTFSNGTRNVDISRDLGGGWWEVGAGANFNLSDATHLYLDFEKAIAGEAEVEWKWNAGVRYSF